jgi:hypothetical protein
MQLKFPLKVYIGNEAFCFVWLVFDHFRVKQTYVIFAFPPAIRFLADSCKFPSRYHGGTPEKTGSLLSTLAAIWSQALSLRMRWVCCALKLSRLTDFLGVRTDL